MGRIPHFALNRWLVERERHWTSMTDRARLGRAFGWLGVVAGIVGIGVLPTLEEKAELPALLALAALVGGVVLSVVPRRLLEAVPATVVTGAVLANQTGFALATGDADSPFLPGFTVIVAAVAASARIRLTAATVILAGAGLLAVALADAVLLAPDVMRVAVETAVLMLIGMVMSRLAWRRRVDVARASRRLERVRASAIHVRIASETDALTGYGNRRAFERALVDRRIRGRTDLVLLMADVDGLKSLNDGLGHETGDLVLRDIAQALAARLRPDDRLFRIGGDEFAAILERSPAEAIRRRFGTKLTVEVDGIGPVSVSIGVAGALAGVEPNAVLRLADEAMYARKRGDLAEPREPGA